MTSVLYLILLIDIDCRWKESTRRN